MNVINAALDNNVPIRVGVNAGSLEKDLQKKYGEPNADALVESALRHVEILDKYNFENYKMMGYGIWKYVRISRSLPFSLSEDEVLSHASQELHPRGADAARLLPAA